MTSTPLKLNDRAVRLADSLLDNAERYRIASRTAACGARLLDFGIEAVGGIEAGIALARLCLADLAEVQIVRAPTDLFHGAAVQVATDHPVAACLASQYAGWEVKGEKFFAMGSGPMRAAAASEELFQKIGLTEKSDQALGVLETGNWPNDDVIQQIAERAHVKPSGLTLACAPVTSLAGAIQVVSRSVETALHKLHYLGFDLSTVVSGWGIAPVPPPANKTIEGIGRTNDAILYGGEVTLYVHSEDATVQAIGPQVPSSSSRDYGMPFKEIYAQHGNNFYKIDPLLFSPAVVTFINLATGNSFRFGHPLPRVIHESFGAA